MTHEAPWTKRWPGRSEPVSEPVPSQRGPILAVAHERLSKALGPVRAAQVVREALVAFGDRRFETPQDLLDLAGHLIERGGLVQVVGHALKVQALLRGAME